MADEYDISQSPLGQRMAGGAKAGTDFGAHQGGGMWDALSEIPGAIASDIGYSLQSIPHLPAALTPANGTIGFLDKSVGDEELRHRKRAVADAALLLAGAGFGKLAAAVQRGAAPTILKVLLGGGLRGAATAGAVENTVFSQLNKMPGEESNIPADLAVGALFGAGAHTGLGWLGKKFAKPTEEAAKKVGTAEGVRGITRMVEEAIAEDGLRRDANVAMEHPGSLLDVYPEIQDMKKVLLQERYVALAEGRTDWVDDATRRAARVEEGEPKRVADLLEGDFVLPSRDATRRFLHAEAGQHTWANRNERLKFASETLGRPVTTYSDLNSLEALNVVNAMRARRGMNPIRPPKVEANASLVKVRGGHTKVMFETNDQKLIYELPDRISKGFLPEGELARLAEHMGVPEDGVPAASTMYRDFVQAAVKANGPGRLEIPSFADFMDKMPDMVVRTRNEILASMTNRTEPNAAATAGRAGRRAVGRAAQVESEGAQRGRKSNKKESALSREQIKKGGKPKTDGPDEAPPPQESPGTEPDFTRPGPGRPPSGGKGGVKLVPVTSIEDLAPSATQSMSGRGARPLSPQTRELAYGRFINSTAAKQAFTPEQRVQMVKAIKDARAYIKADPTKRAQGLETLEKAFLPAKPTKEQTQVWNRVKNLIQEEFLGADTGPGNRGTGKPRQTKALTVKRANIKNDWSPVAGAPKRAGFSSLRGAQYGPLSVTARAEANTNSAIIENLTAGNVPVDPELRQQFIGRAKRLANQEARDSEAFQKLKPAEQAAYMKKTIAEKFNILLRANYNAEAKRSGEAMLADLYNNHNVRVVQVSSRDGVALMKMLEKDGLVSETTNNRWALKTRAAEGAEVRRPLQKRKGKVTAGKIGGMKPKEQVRAKFTQKELEKAGTGALVKADRHPRYPDLAMGDPEVKLRDLEVEYNSGKLAGRDYNKRKAELLKEKHNYDNPPDEGLGAVPVAGSPPPEPVRPASGRPSRKASPGRSTPAAVAAPAVSNPNLNERAPGAKIVDPMEGEDFFAGMDVVGGPAPAPTPPPSPPIAGSTNLDKPVRVIAFTDEAGNVYAVPGVQTHGEGWNALKERGVDVDKLVSSGFGEGGKYTPTSVLKKESVDLTIRPEDRQKLAAAGNMWRMAVDEGATKALINDHEFQNTMKFMVAKFDAAGGAPAWTRPIMKRIQEILSKRAADFRGGQ